MQAKLQRPRRGGFTLIEILVVVAIISILVAILVANFSDARKNSRNKTVKTALSEMQLALEVYKAQIGSYPTPASALQGALVPNFIHGLPVASDYANSACSFVYSPGPGGSYYKLTAQNCFAGATSPANGVSPNDEFARCPSTCPVSGSCVPSTAGFYESMAVYSIGGECM